MKDYLKEINNSALYYDSLSDDAKKATDKKKTVSPQKGMGGKTKPKV